MRDGEDIKALALSEAERALLRDPARYLQRGGLSLAGRSLSELEVRDLSVEPPDWQGARVERVSFIDCTFMNIDFTQAQMFALRFLRCSFTNCRYVDTQFDGCHFRECRWVEGIARGTVLSDCHFEASTIEAVTFERARFDGVRLDGGKINDTRLSECQVHMLQLARTEVESVRLTLCQTGRLALRDCGVNRLSLLGGAVGSIELQGGTLNDVSLAELSCQALEVRGLPTMLRFRVLGCAVQQLELVDCRNALGLYLYNSELTRLRMSRGSYMGWVTECRLGPGSEIADATLLAFFWDKSEVAGLSLRRVRFEDFLCARGTRFHGLQIAEASYGDGFRLVLDDAQFLDHSARFRGDTR